MTHSPRRTAALLLLAAAAACSKATITPPDEPAAADPATVAQGRQIFRYDDFGDWRFWTDTAQLHTLVQGVPPKLALQLGLKVDAEAIPPAVLQSVLANPASLDDPATTRALLSLDAVVGLKATVAGDRITRIGITCALCHSTVDNSTTTGIGHRQDGYPNRDLAVGKILSLLPGLSVIAGALHVSSDALRNEFESWKPGFYDARVNLDGKLAAPPVVIPPAYGLQHVGLETYTGEGPISYWNAYVGVTQMHGHGSFSDPKLGVNIVVPPAEDEVTSKLAALRVYQHSLAAPQAPAGSYNAAAAARGKLVFQGAGKCSSCHAGVALTDDARLHTAAETGMEPTWAQRGTTGKYRTTPLRGLMQHPPYFHDGSAATLADVVGHYESRLGLNLTTAQRADLIEYLKTL